MSDSQKPMSQADMEQAVKYAFNDQDRTIAVGTFVSGLVGRKVTRTDFDSVTEDYTYTEGALTLYVLRVIYTDVTKADLVSVERIS